MLTAGVLAGFGYAWHARRHPAPLLDFTLMRIPTFMVAVVAGTLFRIGIGAIPFLLPLMLQIGFGHSAAESGLITFASSAGALVMKPAAMTALRRFGFRDTLVVNAVISTALLALCAAFRPSWPMLAIYAALLFGGFFRSLQFTAYNTLAYADIPRLRMSAATSLYSTVQQVSMTLGVTIGAACLEVAMTLSHAAQPTLWDFSAAFIVVSLVTLVAAPIGLLMPVAAGEELSGHAMRAGGGGGGRGRPAAEAPHADAHAVGAHPVEAD
jgi:MFS family permease